PTPEAYELATLGGPTIITTDRIAINRGSWWEDMDEEAWCDNPDLHCYDSEINCGEVALNIGGACGQVPPCFGKPLLKRGTFRVQMILEGRDASGQWVQISAVGNPGNHTFNLFAELYYDCQCKHSWVVDENQRIDGLLDDADLQIYDQLRLKKKDIWFSGNSMPLIFHKINANDPYEDMARQLIIRFSGTHETGPKVDAPNHTAGMATTYAYNFYNQLIREESPDKGVTEYVYDSQHRLKFWQTAAQKVDNRFSYIDYDANGRVIERGEALSETGAHKVWFQDEAVEPALPDPTYVSVLHPLLRDGTFGATLYGKQERHYIEYDQEGSNFPASLPNYAHQYLKGKVSKTANEASSTWYGYDQRGRLSWTVQYVDELNRYFTINYAYNAQSNIQRVDFQKETPGERFVHHYTYDANGRMHQVHTSRDGVATTLNATYHYFQHGPLKRVELGTELQGIDYVYTLNGRLKSINNPVLGTRDPGQDGEEGHAHHAFARDIF
ncbi:MAG: hypothetical protein AAGB22_11335, partial [Bacteroidota bacterium]